GMEPSATRRAPPGRTKTVATVVTVRRVVGVVPSWIAIPARALMARRAAMVAIPASVQRGGGAARQPTVRQMILRCARRVPRPMTVATPVSATEANGLAPRRTVHLTNAPRAKPDPLWTVAIPSALACRGLGAANPWNAGGSALRAKAATTAAIVALARAASGLVPTRIVH